MPDSSYTSADFRGDIDSQTTLVSDLEKKLHLITTFNFIVDVSATAVAFFGMVLITSVRHQMSRRTACHRCGKIKYPTREYAISSQPVVRF